MWIIYIVASLFVLLLFILCIPVDITLHFNTNQKPKFSAKLKWLFGLYTSELGASKKHISQEAQPRQKALASNDIVNILLIRGLFRQLSRLIKRILNVIKIRKLVADIKIGLENPADLGLLFAFLAPFNILVGAFSPYPIIIRPDFSDESPLRGHIYGIARVLPILTIIPIFEFLLSKPGFKVIRKLLSAT